MDEEGFSVTECLGGSMELAEEELGLRYQVCRSFPSPTVRRLYRPHRGAYGAIFRFIIRASATQDSTSNNRSVRVAFLSHLMSPTDPSSVFVPQISPSSCPTISGISVVPPPPALARPKAQGMEETYCSPSWEERSKACRRVDLHSKK